MPRPHTSLMRKKVWWLLSTWCMYAWFVLSQQSLFWAKRCKHWTLANEHALTQVSLLMCFSTTCIEMVLPGTDSNCMAFRLQSDKIPNNTAAVPKCYCSLMPRPHTSLMRKKVWWLLSTWCMYAWFVLSQQSLFWAKRCKHWTLANEIVQSSRSKLTLWLNCKWAQIIWYYETKLEIDLEVRGQYLLVLGINPAAVNF